MNKGFTLIETFVAVAILAIAVLGPLMLLSKFIMDATFARHQIVASFAAQEGVELVLDKINRNKNDIPDEDKDPSGAFNPNGWLDGLTLCQTRCNSKKPGDPFLSVGVAGEEVIRADNAVYNNGMFKRIIQISCSPVDNTCLNQVHVKSTIIWYERGAKKEIMIETIGTRII